VKDRDMEQQLSDDRWSTRRIVVVLTAAFTASALALAVAAGVLTSRVAHTVDGLAQSSGSGGSTAGTPTPGVTPSPGASPVPGTGHPQGPVSVADATAALADYDTRNAAAIKARTRQAWMSVDEGAVLASDVWLSAAQAAAEQTGHPFPASALPTTTLVRLLGSGTSADSTWFEAVVTFGTERSGNTYVSLYDRTGSSGHYKLVSMAGTNPTSVPEASNGSGWSGTPRPTAQVVDAVTQSITSGKVAAGVTVDQLAARILFAVGGHERSITYACDGAPDLAPGDVTTVSGPFRTAVLSCTATTLPVSGATLGWNAYDEALKGGQESLRELRCPVAVTVGFVSKPDGTTTVTSADVLQTATCTGTRAQAPGSA
jgi:hypothetical protein